MQQTLVPIYKKLKLFLKKYEPPLIPKFDMDSKYDLWSMKDVVIANRKRKEVYFAGLIIQSTYVGFYFMPIYTDTHLKSIFGSELLHLLKGKSCFHIKSLTPIIEKQIEFALKKGFLLYKKRGWI